MTNIQCNLCENFSPWYSLFLCMLIKHENLGLGKVRVCLGAFLKTVFDLEFFCSWTIRSENAAANVCQGCECSFCLQSFTLWSLGLNFSFVIVFELCWIKIVWCLEKFPCEIFWFWAGFGGKYDEYFLCLFWCIWRECNSQTFKEEELSIKNLRSLSSPLWSGEEYNGGCRIAHYSILSWFKLRLGGFVLSFLQLIFYFWLLLWCILCTLVYNLHAYPKILSEFRSSVAI